MGISAVVTCCERERVRRGWQGKQVWYFFPMKLRESKSFENINLPWTKRTHTRAHIHAHAQREIICNWQQISSLFIQVTSATKPTLAWVFPTMPTYTASNQSMRDPWFESKSPFPCSITEQNDNTIKQNMSSRSPFPWTSSRNHNHWYKFSLHTSWKA